MSATKAELHAIVDRLGEECAEAVLVLVRNCLDDEETLSPEEESDIEQALDYHRAGNSVKWEDLKRELEL